MLIEQLKYNTEIILGWEGFQLMPKWSEETFKDMLGDGSMCLAPLEKDTATLFLDPSVDVL